MASNSNVNNLSRDYSSIKTDLINFSKKYYPELATNFQDSSVGSWFIDLVSSVGDSLNYAIDRAYQETQSNMAQTKEAALNNAMMNGVKIPGEKASTCEVRFSCILPAATSENLGSPDWQYAPKIRRGAVVASGAYTYELQEDVDFHEQFNSDGYSNRTFVPNRNSNGLIDGYTVTKTAIVVGGTSKVYKKLITSSDVQPFMEIVLPDKDVMNVESIIFKESSNFNTSPKLYEYYMPLETWKSNDEAIYTHRFFEVDSLADQYVFVDEVEEIDGKAQSVVESKQTESGDEIDAVYKGKWMTVRQKFITEYTPSGYMKIIFGSSNAASDLPENQTAYADYIMSNILNNEFLGVLPDINWTMFVLYRVGGGTETNIAPGGISTISYMNVETPYLSNDYDASERSTALNSISVTNTSTALGGKDAPSVKEIQYLTKYSIGAQGRCVTVKDYKARVMMMPPRYGCPFRVSVIEENNKIVLSMLGMNPDGTLTNELSSTLEENVKLYMENYKMLTDYLEMRSGKIYNLQFEISLYLDKTYDTNDVATNVINTVQEYMSVENHDMGEDIFIGDLQKEITSLDGVISIIEFKVYNIYNDPYSANVSSLPIYTDGVCGDTEQEANRFRIDLDALDGFLPSDYNSMYEIKIPATDIKLKIKLK